MNEGIKPRAAGGGPPPGRRRVPRVCDKWHAAPCYRIHDGHLGYVVELIRGQRSTTRSIGAADAALPFALIDPGREADTVIG